MRAGTGIQSGEGPAGGGMSSMGSGGPLGIESAVCEEGDKLCLCRENPGAEGCRKKEKVDGENKTPWQKLADLAQMLLAVGGALLGIAHLMKMTGYGAAYARYLAYLAALCGAAASALGVAVLAYGQTLQGAIYTVSGGLLAYWGYTFSAEGAQGKEGLKKAVEPQMKDASNKLGASDLNGTSSSAAG